MNRLFNNNQFRMPLFIISSFIYLIGLGLFSTTPVKALEWSNAYSHSNYISPDYKMYSKSGNYLYRVNNGWKIINYLPQVQIKTYECGSSTGVGYQYYSLFTPEVTFTDCRGIEITPKAGSEAWFNEAQFSWRISDFDNSENIAVDGGYIKFYGSSTLLNPNPQDSSFATSVTYQYARDGSDCNSPSNPNTSNTCSLGLYFNANKTKSFSIKLDNRYPWGFVSSGHEYWYSGPVLEQYRTLTLDPSGGSVSENNLGLGVIWRHSSGGTIIREYSYNYMADNFPQPTRPGYDFLGWYDYQGNLRSVYLMGSDTTLYAHWKQKVNWNITPSSSVDKTTAIPGDVVTWTHKVRNNGPTATNSNITYDYISSNGFTGNGTDKPVLSGFGAYTEHSHTSSYTVTANDAGKTLCRATRVWPRSSSSSVLLTSSSSCVTIPYRWNMSVSTSVDKTTVLPGETINWTHRLTNTGVTKTNGNITYHYNNGGNFTPGSGANISNVFSSNQTRSFSSSYRATNSDLGKTLCRSVSASPASWSNSGWTTSNCASVTVPYRYSLNPTVSLNPSGVVEAGTVVGVTPAVSNVGPTISKNTSWELSRKLNNGSYSQVSSGSVFFGLGNTRLTTYNDNATTELTAGTRICYRASVAPRSATDNNRAYSSEVCVTIGKKPKIQIWGGNLISGANVDTSASKKNVSGRSRVFGSWAEYGVFASGSIKGMASASGFAGEGLDLGSSASPLTLNACMYSTLSFTNTPLNGSYCSSSGLIGDYKYNYPDRDIAISFGDDRTIGSNNVVANNLLSNPGVYVGRRTGNLTLNTSTLDQGKSVILKVSGDVTITGNQSYNNGPYDSAKQLPQLIIIANNINIAEDVTNIDAWLIAKNGTINTCNVTGNLTINRCNKQLVVNGPVVGKDLILKRTFGSGTGSTSGDPAEIFNLRADTMLWSASHADTRNIIRSVYTNELPPRF